MRERTESRDSYDEYGEYDAQSEHEYASQGRMRYPERTARGHEGPSRDTAAKGRKSRTPVVLAAVLAIAAGGTIAVAESGVLKKKDAAPPLSGGPLTVTPVASSAATTPASSGTTPTTGSQTQPGLSAPIGGAEVGTFYGIVQHTLNPEGVMASDAAAVPKLFASTSALHAYWSSAGKPTTAATCGAKTPTLAVVETPEPSSGGGATVRVDLFEKGKLAAKAASVGVDGSGKITSIKCVAAAMPEYPGLSYVLSTYGKDQIPTKQIKNSIYAPPSQDAAAPMEDGDFNVCAQFHPGTWVFYAPVATAAGTAWRFSYDQVTYPLLPDLFVDPTSGSAERVVCEGLPSIPGSDLAAAGKDSHMYGGDPADALVTYLLQGYARERSLVSAGAQPTQEMAPYFASDDTFQAALRGTGKIPLLCADKDPFWVVASGIGTVSGTTEAVEVKVQGAPTDGNQADAPTIGKATYTVDLTTMKITGIACH